jgi:hypothetical protein
LARRDAGIGALRDHLDDGAALVVDDAGVGDQRLQDDARAGLVGRADPDPAHPALSDVVADLEAEGVAIEDQAGVRVAMREKARVHDGIPAVACPSWRRYVLGGTPTNSVKRLLNVPSDAQPTAKQTSVTLTPSTQQRHRPLDTPRHQIAVRRLAVGKQELAAEMPSRHVHAAGKRLNVQRLHILPVDPVADAAQPREVAQVLRRSGSAGHLRDRATYDYM